MKKRNRLAMVLGIIACITIPHAVGAVSYELHNATEYIGTGAYWASGNTDVVIGPNARITVNGDWYITASKVYIHPSAQISGTGAIHLLSPAVYGAPAAPTGLDAGGVTIGCILSAENENTISLTYIDPSVTYAASGITDTHASGTDDLVLANSLNFGNTGAHVVLNTSNVIFTSAAAAALTYTDLNTIGFSPDPAPPAAAYAAYLVTNGANSGYVVKQGIAANGSFSFPVGQSGPLTANYDYSPVSLTNKDAVAHNFSVRVQTYANSGSSEGGATKGMDRTWNIYSDAVASAVISLVHNTVTNTAGPTTNGSGFDNTAAFVSQQLSPGAWYADTVTGNGGSPVSTHTGTFTLPSSGTAATAYFTKSSDIINSVGDVLSVQPVVMLQGAMSGTTMTTALNTLGVIPKTQPYGTLYSYSGKERVTAIPANVTDWVLVELRDASSPATIIAKRAAFVKSNGTVVDIDGTSSVAFSGVPAGNYFVAVRHRNHLGIRTPSSVNLSLNAAAVPYDFTTAQGQAYQNSGNTVNTAMKDMGNGIFAMWGGDVNTNSKVSYQGLNNDYSALVGNILGGNLSTVINNTYSNGDLNLNGKVNGQGLSNDFGFLTGNVLNNVLTAIYNAHL